jgi:hypothetical protein
MWIYGLKKIAQLAIITLTHMQLACVDYPKFVLVGSVRPPAGEEELVLNSRRAGEVGRKN